MPMEIGAMERVNYDSAKTLEQLVKGLRVTLLPVFRMTSENVLCIRTNDYNFNLHNEYVLQYRMYK